MPLPVPASYPLTIVIHGSVTMAVHTSLMLAETPNSPAPAFPTTFVPFGSMERSYARCEMYTFLSPTSIQPVLAPPSPT